MSIITIGSSNPDLSFILQKNPATIAESKKPYTREIRRGVAYGWYTTDGEFRLWFKDSPNDISFFRDGDSGEYEYLDRTRYSSPIAINSLITECLSTALKTQDEKDVKGPYEAWLEAPVEIKSKSMARHLETQFTDDTENTFTLIKLGEGDLFIMRITGPTVHQVLNRAITAAILISTSAPDLYVDLKGNLVDKYARCMNGADAPYFIRYLFKRNVFSNFDTFRKNKEQLDAPGIDLAFGDTHRQRMDAIYPILKRRASNTIHEIGTGEGKYTIKLATMYGKVIGWEPEEWLREKVEGKLKSRQLDAGLELREGITAEKVREARDDFKNADILMTEVFEHIEKDEATEILNELVKTEFSQIVFTMPDRDFNKHYKLEQPFRHDDHKWEPTYPEFTSWVLDAVVAAGLSEEDYAVTITQIGDKVYEADGSYRTPSVLTHINRLIK